MYNNEPDLFMGEDPEFMDDLFEFDEPWTVHDDDKLLGALSNGNSNNNNTTNTDVTDGNNQIWDSVAGDLNRTRTECEMRYRQLMYITGGRSPASTRSTRSFQNVFSAFPGTTHNSSSSSSNNTRNIHVSSSGGSGSRMFGDHSSSSGRSPLGLRLEEGLGTSIGGQQPNSRRETPPGDDNLRRSLINNSNLRFLSGNLNTTNLSSLLSTLQNNRGSSSPLKKRRAIHVQDLFMEPNASYAQSSRSSRGLLSPNIASKSSLNFRLPSSPSSSAAPTTITTTAAASFTASSPSSRGRNVTFADGNDFVEFSDQDFVPNAPSNHRSSSRSNVVRRGHQDTNDPSLASTIPLSTTTTTTSTTSLLQGSNRSPEKPVNKRRRTHSEDINDNESSPRNHSDHSHDQISSKLVMKQSSTLVTTERRSRGRQKGNKSNVSSNINDSNSDNDMPVDALVSNSVRSPRNSADGNSTFSSSSTSSSSSSSAHVSDALNTNNNQSRAPSSLIRPRGRPRSNSSTTATTHTNNHLVTSKGTNSSSNNDRARMRSMSLEEVAEGAAVLSSLGSPRQTNTGGIADAGSGSRRYNSGEDTTGDHAVQKGSDPLLKIFSAIGVVLRAAVNGEPSTNSTQGVGASQPPLMNVTSEEDTEDDSSVSEQKSLKESGEGERFDSSQRKVVGNGRKPAAVKAKPVTQSSQSRNDDDDDDNDDNDDDNDDDDDDDDDDENLFDAVGNNRRGRRKNGRNLPAPKLPIKSIPLPTKSTKASPKDKQEQKEKIVTKPHQKAMKSSSSSSSSQREKANGMFVDESQGKEESHGNGTAKRKDKSLTVICMKFLNHIQKLHDQWSSSSMLTAKGGMTRPVIHSSQLSANNALSSLSSSSMSVTFSASHLSTAGNVAGSSSGGGGGGGAQVLSSNLFADPTPIAPAMQTITRGTPSKRMPALLVTAHLAPLIIHTDIPHGDGSMMDGLMTSSSSASNGSSTLLYTRTHAARTVGMGAARGMDAQLPCDPTPRVHLSGHSQSLLGGGDGNGGAGGDNSDGQHVFFATQEPTATVNNSSTKHLTDSNLSSPSLHDDGRHSKDTETSATSNALASDAGSGAVDDDDGEVVYWTATSNGSTGTATALPENNEEEDDEGIITYWTVQPSSTAPQVATKTPKEDEEVSSSSSSSSSTESSKEVNLVSSSSSSGSSSGSDSREGSDAGLGSPRIGMDASTVTHNELPPPQSPPVSPMVGTNAQEDAEEEERRVLEQSLSEEIRSLEEHCRQLEAQIAQISEEIRDTLSRGDQVPRTLRNQRDNMEDEIPVVKERIRRQSAALNALVTSRRMTPRGGRRRTSPRGMGMMTSNSPRGLLGGGGGGLDRSLHGGGSMQSLLLGLSPRGQGFGTSTHGNSTMDEEEWAEDIYACAIAGWRFAGHDGPSMLPSVDEDPLGLVMQPLRIDDAPFAHSNGVHAMAAASGLPSSSSLFASLSSSTPRVSSSSSSSSSYHPFGDTNAFGTNHQSAAAAPAPSINGAAASIPPMLTNSTDHFDAHSVAMDIGVNARRIYDLIEIFEPLGMVKVLKLGTFVWLGPTALLQTFGLLQQQAIARHPEDALRYGLIDEPTAASLLARANPSSIGSFAFATVEVADKDFMKPKFTAANVIVRCCLSLFLLGRTSWTTDELIAELFPCDAIDVLERGMTDPLPAPHTQMISSRGEATTTCLKGTIRHTIKGKKYKYTSKGQLPNGEYFNVYHSSLTGEASIKQEAGRNELIQADLQVKAVVKNKKDNTTKIRKIYDVLNVLDCIGVLEKSKLKEKEKVHFRKGGFPTAWSWACASPLDLRNAYVKAPVPAAAAPLPIENKTTTEKRKRKR